VAEKTFFTRELVWDFGWRVWKALFLSWKFQTGQRGWQNLAKRKGLEEGLGAILGSNLFGWEKTSY